MKYILFFRHGHAYPYELNNDATRGLIQEGKEAYQKIENAFLNLIKDYADVTIVSSPYVRALESAQILASFIKQDHIKTFDSIVEGDFHQLMKDIDSIDTQMLVIVGHQPSLSEFVYRLSSASVPFEVASCAGLELGSRSANLMYAINNDNLVKLSQ